MMEKLKRDVLFHLSMQHEGDGSVNRSVFTQMMLQQGVIATTVSHVLRVLESEGRAYYHVQRGWCAR